MLYQLAILQLSGFNATGAKWSQQDALGYAADGVVPALLQHGELTRIAHVSAQKVL
ncbi:MAG: serine/threonine protein phosphatase, partial [Alkalimonas sp.]|nr:serine/threonine protein phosphatase [Alkalimonas sp.]